MTRPIAQRGAPFPSRRSVALGFTLLEVMVAVAILGLGLTAIFAAQAGALASVANARNLSQATGLARCKMTEVELDMQKNGLALDDLSEAGPCCDGMDNPRMTCTWHIDRPVFPDAKFGDLQLDTKLDIGGLSAGTAGGPAPANGSGALGLLAQGDQGNIQIPQGSNTNDVAQNLAGTAGGITDGITQMVMSIVYPDLKAVFEAGTRKLTVTVLWNEGSQVRTLEITQWYTDARAAGLNGAIPGTELTDADTGSTGSGGSKTPAAGAPGAGSPGGAFSPPTTRTAP